MAGGMVARVSGRHFRDVRPSARSLGSGGRNHRRGQAFACQRRLFARRCRPDYRDGDQGRDQGVLNLRPRRKDIGATRHSVRPRLRTRRVGAVATARLNSATISPGSIGPITTGPRRDIQTPTSGGRRGADCRGDECRSRSARAVDGVSGGAPGYCHSRPVSRPTRAEHARGGRRRKVDLRCRARRIRPPEGISNRASDKDEDAEQDDERRFNK